MRRNRPAVQWLFVMMALLFSLVLTSLVEKSTSSLITPDAATSTVHSSTRSRGLQTSNKSTRRQFPECIQQKLSPKECQTFIENLIKSEGGHEVGDNINVKIRSPRSTSVMDDTYWMVEVPVNLDGKVACQINDTKTNYPFKWEYASSFYDVESQDCLGLTAGECCLKILRYGQTLGPKSGYDSADNCLSCFVHQVPLSPIVLKEETTYLSYKLFPKWEPNDGFYHPSENGCSTVKYSSDQVDAYDRTLVTIYERAHTLLKEVRAINDANDICLDEIKFDQMLMALWNAAVTIPPLSQLVGQMACRLCYGFTNDVSNVSELDELIDKILDLLTKHIQKSLQYSSYDEHCILIHTDADGNIVKIPELPTIVDDEDTSPIDPNIPCNEDIRVCAEDEYCSSVDYYYYYQERNSIQTKLEYECRTYLQPGESCILWDFPGHRYTLVPDLCDPRVGYCKENPRVCDVNVGHFPANTFPIPGTCTPYGTTCTKENDACDPITEYCHIEAGDPNDDVNHLIGRCETRIEKGICCDPDSEQNTCEYFSSVQLTCFPYLDSDYYLVGHACEVACKTDDECKAIDKSFTTCYMESYYISEPLIKDGYGFCQ